MRKIKLITIIIFLAFNNQVMADTLFKDGFNETGNWEYIADDVMGGVSKGKVQFKKVNGDNHAILSGEVNTKNNGGFIQIRRDLNGINLETAKAIKIIAKGNNQKYFLHIRTNRMFLPWQYYHAEFTVNESFNEYVIPISSFNKSGYFIPGKINSKNITSIGLVAYGRDHSAELHVKEIEFVK